MTWFSNTIQIGRFAAPVWLLAAAAGLAASYIMARIYFRTDRAARRVVVDLFFNAFLVFVIVWKLSPLVFQFRQVIQQPLTLLFLPGGAGGTSAGFAGALAYLTIRLIRERPLSRRFIRGASYSAVALITLFFVFGLLAGLPRASTESDRDAPEFELTGLDSQIHRLSDYRGRYVILNFWASWCGPCRAEIPVLVDFYKSVEDGGPVLLAINQTASEPGTEAVRAFVENNRMEFPVLLDTTSRVHRLFGIRGIPTTVIVSPDGNIVHRRTGAVTRSWLVTTTD